MIRRKNPAMPTPPRTYSSAAAEKLRLALLALAATAVAGCDRVETALGFRTTGVIGPPVPATSEPATVSESDDIILGGEPPIEPAANAAARSTGRTNTNAPAVRLPTRTGGVFLSVPRTNP